MPLLKKLFLREIKLTLADPRRLIFIFGAALAYLLLFKMLFAPNLVKNIPTIIFNDDNTKLSREFVRGFEDSDSFFPGQHVPEEPGRNVPLQGENRLMAPFFTR